MTQTKKSLWLKKLYTKFGKVRKEAEKYSEKVIDKSIDKAIKAVRKSNALKNIWKS